MKNQVYYFRKRGTINIVVRDENGEKLFSTTCVTSDLKRQGYISGILKQKFGIDFTPIISVEKYDKDGFFDY